MMSKISNLIHMDKASLEKLSKSELINLLLKQHKPKNIIVDDTKPVPTPRTYKPVPTPRTYKPVPVQKRPIPTPRKSVKRYGSTV